MTADADRRREAFVGAGGYDLADICYFGESILLPEYRGQGVGREFFLRREAHARQIGAKIATFCAVDRPEDHPLRPPGYLPLDAFWHRRGYEPVEGLTKRFAWKDIDRPAETCKTMQFWMRALD